MTAAAFDITTLVRALIEANDLIKQIIVEERGFIPEGDLEWHPVNQGQPGHTEQVMFVQHFKPVNADLPNFGELKAWARWTAEECNKILTEHGFTIRLEAWPYDRQTFGVVAIYDLTIKWLVKGSIKNDLGYPYLINKRPAFHLGVSEAQISFYDVGRGQPLVRIPGQKSGDYVCLIKWIRPLTGFELLDEVERLRAHLRTRRTLYQWGGVILPNILLDEEVDISWLKSLWTKDETGQIWWVSQAKMQAKFALGPEGARARVAAAMAVTREAVSIPRPDYVVDDNIILWMERDSVTSVPLFSAYVPKDNFATQTVGLDSF